jgi:malonate transporter
MPHVILMALAPFFFVMALGFVAGRMRAIDSHHVDEINALVMNFALPASLFVAITSAPRSEMMRQGPLFVILGIVMLLLYLLWYLFQRHVSMTSKAEASLQALTIAFPNLAGVGLPIASAILGPTETVPVAVALAADSILVSPITLLLLELSGGKEQTDAETSTLLVRPKRFELLIPRFVVGQATDRSSAFEPSRLSVRPMARYDPVAAGR